MPDTTTDRLVELLAPLGDVRPGRMFGGHGVYLDGLMVGLVTGDVAYLKADDACAAVFDGHDAEPFSYTRKDGRVVVTSYREVPADAWDDPALFAELAGHAQDAARRAAARKR